MYLLWLFFCNIQDYFNDLNHLSMSNKQKEREKGEKIITKQEVVLFHSTVNAAGVLFQIWTSDFESSSYCFQDEDEVTSELSERI